MYRLAQSHFHNRAKQCFFTQFKPPLPIGSLPFEAPHKKELFFRIPASKRVNVFSSLAEQPGQPIFLEHFRTRQLQPAGTT